MERKREKGKGGKGRGGKSSRGEREGKKVSNTPSLCYTFENETS